MVKKDFHSWHNKEIGEAFEYFHSGEHGLTREEVKKRLALYGPNRLPEVKPKGFILVFFEQFRSPLIYILLFASGIMLFLGNLGDCLIIWLVIIFNAVVGAVQEGKAQSTLSALKNFAKSNATVLRAGKESIIPDFEVVPGDIIIIQEGEKVSADARIISANSLVTNESALTGESAPVGKNSEIISVPESSIAEQRNMLFKGTNIASGSGKALVVATGIETYIGKISAEISQIDTEIPLKGQIRELSRMIIIAVSVFGAVIFFIGLVAGRAVEEMFSVVVSLAVSVIPEGLPIVMTLVLATGVWRMSKKNALVKRLQAVEALGQASVIAVDKTGTITKNEMMVQKVFVDGKVFKVGGSGYDSIGEIKKDGAIIDPLNHKELILIGKIAAFSSGARVIFSEKEKLWNVAGDPTEASLSVFAQKIGFHKNDLEKEAPKVYEKPFNYEYKYHITVNKVNGGNFVSVTGAPEAVFAVVKTVWSGGKNVVFSAEEREKWKNVLQDFSQQGLRVIAVAVSENSTGENFDIGEIEQLSLLGFFGIQDAIRPEAAGAIKKAMAAGVRVVMITGDYEITARSIAMGIGILKKGEKIIIGNEIEKFSDKALMKNIAGVSVFARVTPHHKLRIIEALKARGEIVAMTGDGVNDAPSLVAADLGVGMGKVGTEVAKEASDIILLDDNFGSIVDAIEEGRSIYRTIKKVILYLLSTGMGEVLTITGALLLGLPIPILATQIIWLNFVTDSFLDVSLAMEPREMDILRQKNNPLRGSLVDRMAGKRILLMSLLMMIGTILLFSFYYKQDIEKAWTISLTTLAAFQWFNAWNCRHEYKSVFQMSFFSNKYLLAATTLVVSLQFLAVYNSFFQKFLHTAPLSFSDWMVIIPVASSVLLGEEIRKYLQRKKRER